MSPSETATCSPVGHSFSDGSFYPRCPPAMAPSALATRYGSSHAQFKETIQLSGENYAQRLISEALQERIRSINPDECDPGAENTFLVADLGEIFRQNVRWELNLPRVEPFYAVKCNSDEKVLALLNELGIGFDCASMAEIKQLLDMGVPPSRIIYANPCKTASYVRYAASEGVHMMTFDNEEELYKVKKFFPEASLFLRIRADDSKAKCQLGLKYGAPLDATRYLLQLAKKLGLNVVGVSFHVGSGAQDPNAFAIAVRDARTVFDEAAEVGFELRTLDVGGGYGNDNFEAIAKVLGPAINDFFPKHIRVIAEPGRYYVSSAFTIATHIIARRTVREDATSRNPSYMLYLNDGVYGNFSGVMYDHQEPVPKVLMSKGRYYYGSQPTHSKKTKYSVWGPTCDGIDCISKSCYLPEVLEAGDWLYFSDMGAYSKCSATKFNGFTNSHDVVYVISDPGAAALLEKSRAGSIF